MFRTLKCTLLTSLAVQFADSRRLDTKSTPENAELRPEKFLQSEEQIEFHSSCTFEQDDCPSDAAFEAFAND